MSLKTLEKSLFENGFSFSDGHLRGPFCGDISTADFNLFNDLAL